METSIINRNSGLPLYQQLYDILRSRIVHGDWEPGDMIPTESGLIETYQVSRAVARQALDMLVSEGLIYRQRGRGTFVAHPTLEQSLVRIVSFTEDMQQRGMEPETHVLFSGLVLAPEDVAEPLGIEPGEELARLDRLRLANGELLSIEHAFLVHRYCPGIIGGDYAKSSLRAALRDQHGIRLIRARQTIRAIGAPRELARELEIRAGAALLFIERVSFSQHNRPVEFLRKYYRGDRYSLYNELLG